MASDNDKKELSLLILKIIVLIILIVLALKSFKFVSNARGNDAIYLVPLFTLFLLLIGFVIWSLFGEQISAPIASFFLQSGGVISKTKYYSRARALVMQNKLQEAIKLYQKILNEENNDIIAYSEMADIYFEKLKDYSSAFNCYDKIEQYAQESTDIIFAIDRKADIYISNNNYSKAIEELGKITQKFPKTKDAFRAEERIKNLHQKINPNT